jgi:hypothetical protein
MQAQIQAARRSGPRRSSLTGEESGEVAECSAARCLAACPELNPTLPSFPSAVLFGAGRLYEQDYRL